MPIDTSIYNNVRPFTMTDPYESAGKALALQIAQRKFTLEDDISRAGAESGGDPERMAAALLAKGHYQPALQLRSQAATLGKEQRLSRNADVDHKLKIAEATGSDAMMLDQVYRQALQSSGGNRDAAMQAAQAAYQPVRDKWAQLGNQLPDQFDPDANFAFIGQAKEAIQYLKTLAPEVAMQDTGGTVTPINKNPLAGPVGPLAGSQPMQKTAAPAAPTELARYQAERAHIAQANPNDPRLPEYDRAIAGFKAGSSTTVNVKEGQRVFENENKLRDDYKADPVVKASAEMQSAFNTIEAAYKRPSAANDLAMATKYMKILDPTSVVRESEFALAVNATGLLDKVQNYAASVLQGKKLNPAQRKDFYDSAKSINDAFQGKRSEIDQQYSELATGYGLNPKNVIPSLRTPKKSPAKDEKPAGKIKFLGFE